MVPLTTNDFGNLDGWVGGGFGGLVLSVFGSEKYFGVWGLDSEAWSGGFG